MSADAKGDTITAVESRRSILLALVLLVVSFLLAGETSGASTKSFKQPGAPGALPPIKPAELLSARPVPLPDRIPPSLGSEGPAEVTRATSRRLHVPPLPRTSHGLRAIEDDPNGEATVSVSGRLVTRYSRFDIYTCSATIINTDSASLIVTAAHCLVDEDGYWARSYAFVPGYDNGNTPYGIFYAKQGWISKQYARSANPEYDYGVLALGRNGQGQRAAVAAGGAGFSVNEARSNRYRINGYPGGANGSRTLRSCFSNSWAGPSRIGGYAFPGPLSVSANCDMARGSSGGGWFRDTFSEDGYMLNGVTSTGNRSFTRLTTPYFGMGIWRLIFSSDRKA